MTTISADIATSRVRLEDFIWSHRSRFEIRQDNIFAMSWGKITRRLTFLGLIEERYKALSRAYVENSKASQQLIEPGENRVSHELSAMFEEAQRLSIELHLQIESYYLFAKIILDDITRALEYYFGPARNLALDSHDNFCARLQKYASAKNLVVDPDLHDAALDLKRCISDIRDYQISHEKSPRTATGFSYGGSSSGVRLTISRFFPKESEQGHHVQTEDLSKLGQSLGLYINLVIAFIENNQTKTRLALKT
jgi:hypothetical protein